MRKFLLLTCGLLFAVGCAHSSQTSSAPNAEVQRARPAREDVVARRAHLPIDYLIIGKQVVRVEDATTGQRVWERHLNGNSQIRIAADGIRVNEKRVFSRKLKKTHVYQIVLVRQ